MRVGNICFSDEFFSTTQTVREVKQVLEDELVRLLSELPSLPSSRLHTRVRSATSASWWSPQKPLLVKQKRRTLESVADATTTWCLATAKPAVPACTNLRLVRRSSPSS